MPGFYQPSEEDFDPSIDDFVPVALSKERRYMHFDLPLDDDERQLQNDFTSPSKPHRFWPLLGYNDVTRRFTRDKTGHRVESKKIRPIRFAGHEDAAYLQAYAAHLEPFYESALKADGSSASVLAYRRGGGTNIHHAKSLFDEIRERRDCSVFAMDISGFFDCLDHTILRDQIASLLGVTRLNGHHASVWKNLTRYSWVETEHLDKVLGEKRQRNGRVCTPDDFVAHVQGRKSGLINVNEDPFGIPQGTPISGLYANIYLREFDRIMIQQCAKYGGSYRRYSDDIAVVLPLGASRRRVTGLVEKLLADYGLAMSVDKTETADFKNGRLCSPRPIQYLGFTFDGVTTLIRPSSLDAYRRKMRRGIHAKMMAGKGKEVAPLDVYKRESLSRYTHLGKRRNFLTYAYKAAEIMDAPEIRQQVKKHVTWFNRAWDAEVRKIGGGLVVNTA